jgi:GntR family transcriptional repressor for pyruvate dehydrogenase complex
VSSADAETVGPSNPVSRPTKTAILVAHALAERVAALTPGDVLPPERDLIAELRVGRNTLREALRLLEAQGVVVVKTGSRGGPVVSLPDHRPLADTLSVYLQSSESAYREVIQARRAIEADLARLAAEHATPEAIAAISASVDTMAARLDNEERFLEENLNFHEMCARAADNSVLQVFHSSLKAISDGHIIGVTYSPKQRVAILAAHDKIAKAIASGDPRKSYETMNDHMREFEEYLKRRFPHVLNRRIRWMLPAQ